MTSSSSPSSSSQMYISSRGQQMHHSFTDIRVNNTSFLCLPRLNIEERGKNTQAKKKEPEMTNLSSRRNTEFFKEKRNKFPLYNNMSNFQNKKRHFLCFSSPKIKKKIVFMLNVYISFIPQKAATWCKQCSFLTLLLKIQPSSNETFFGTAVFIETVRKSDMKTSAAVV